MSSWTMLPRTPLGTGPLGRAFAERGCQSFRDVATLLQQLPYGRTSRPQDYSLVLREGRGTCSSKHALAALLANELGVDAELTLACFEMTEETTPGVGATLDRHGLAAILEAHCYLRYGGRIIDLTWPEPPLTSAFAYIDELTVRPDELAATKPVYHRSKLASWGEKQRPSLSLDVLWAVREECIAALQRA